MYRVAKASEYLAITGNGIRDVKLAKKAFIYPCQTCTKFDITPYNYTFDVQAMSSEKLPFILPAVFTIGPRANDDEALYKYAKLLAPHDKHSDHVQELVKGVIEGETRVLAASMTMEQIFGGTKQFKKEVFEKVQLELDQFGLHIYNANVKQLVDERGYEYFSYLGQKTQQGAANQAKVDVAEAKYKGDVGAKEREGLTLQNAAKVDAETLVFSKTQKGRARQEEVRVIAEVKIYENQREAEIAEADARLATMKAQFSQQTEIAQIEATKRAEIRSAELKKELEIKNALAAMERMRAESLAKATVDYEAAVQAANTVFYEKQKEADALLYGKEKEAEGRRMTADAMLYAKQKEAEANLYFMQKEAEGMMEKAKAQGEFVARLLQAFGGNFSSFHDYMIIDRGIYQEMGKMNADALRGLQPKISVWTTRGDDRKSLENSSDPGTSAMKQISDVYKMIPPLLSTVKDQTGMNYNPSLIAGTFPGTAMIVRGDEDS
eukprot:Gb_17374 [translate_table: standard]